ncbi:MAG: SUMF1/EgtB/PvdO family nonheme iron enzyme [Anaerolineaceae bacterium]|nr:SUMF1/EgtB/PvdO family nonheme iron enzyme [Anaerolineaceae bacterium]
MIEIESLTPEQKILWTRINDMMEISYGCAESFVVAVSEILWGEVDPNIQMISTGFSGGVGGTHEELCGGVSGAAIILGLIYGRTINDEALMIRCKRLIAEQRDRFVAEFGTTVCQELRDAQFGADEDNPCSAMIAPAAFMLLDILEEEKQREAALVSDQKANIKNVLPINEYIEKFENKPVETLITQLDHPELTHAHRDWIGDQLNTLGDPRSGICFSDNNLPEISWVAIPQGCVEVERAGDFDVDACYLAKYPITFKQFQAFCNDPKGYFNPAWWQGMAVKPDHISSPGEQRFKIDNHPRENVSWYDALAFCRWLTEKIKTSEINNLDVEVANRIKNLDWEIRLPTEWEWQMAATNGNLNNKFPWGLEWEDNRAHTKHNQLNKTVAVGLYPSGISETGVFDMSGNVWEWCLNCYEDPKNIDFNRDDRRVLRGGSWYHWGSYAHTDMRSRYYPDHRYNAGGFRICCAKILS